MIRGLYTAASGMTTQLTNQEVISNNLANADTTGYKKDTAVTKAFQSLLLNRVGDNTDRGMDVVMGNLGTGSTVDGVFTDYSQGAIKATENKLDVALATDGFFVVQTPGGELYTRDGSFTIASNGDLVTKDGYGIVGTRGTINVAGANEITFTADGTVVVDGQVINKLRVVTAPEANAFVKVGKNLFTVQQGATVEDSSNARVAQGFLETSNVNVVSEMVNMISGLRIYEANQKSIASQSSTLEKLINESRV